MFEVRRQTCAAEVDHLRLECAQPRGDLASDVAHANDADAFAAQLAQDGFADAPRAALDAVVQLHQASIQRQDEQQRVLGDDAGIAAAEVGHRDPVALGEIEVDVLVTGAHQLDQLESLASAEVLLGELDRGGDPRAHEKVGLGAAGRGALGARVAGHHD